MWPVIDAMKERRSIRKFKVELPEKEDIWCRGLCFRSAGFWKGKGLSSQAGQGRRKAGKRFGLLCLCRTRRWHTELQCPMGKQARQVVPQLYADGQ